jgi:hypothetical protein
MVIRKCLENSEPRKAYAFYLGILCFRNYPISLYGVAYLHATIASTFSVNYSCVQIAETTNLISAREQKIL